MAGAPLPDGVHGWCDDRFASVATTLGAQIESGVHDGAAVAIRHRGVPVVDLWAGSFAEDSLVVSFSTTKGVVATAVHMAMERADLSYDTPVVTVWPEFGQAGKESVTIRHLLCHEAGIPQIRDVVPDIAFLAGWDAMVATVEALPPLWKPGTANGYHALTWGWLAGELIHRVDGRPLQQFLADELTAPLGLDGCFVGTPADHVHRLVPVLWNPIYLDMPTLDQLLPPDSLTLQAVAPRGDMVTFVNSDVGRSACVPAITGAFTARSLATLYAALAAGGTIDGVRLLSPATVATATEVQNDRPDLVLFTPVYWRLGYMGFGLGLGANAGVAPAAFGHAGLGGSVAGADPVTGLAVAVTLNRLELNVMGDDRAAALVRAAAQSVADL